MNKKNLQKFIFSLGVFYASQTLCTDFIEQQAEARVIETVNNISMIETSSSYVFHGSPTQGLQTIKPQVSTHQQPWVYAAESPALALIFTREFYDNDIQISVDTRHGQTIYILKEKYHDAFNTFFNGQSGSIYQLNSAGFLEGQTTWNPDLVSTQPKQVLKEFRIQDVLAALQECSSRGSIQLVNYSNTCSVQ